MRFSQFFEEFNFKLEATKSSTTWNLFKNKTETLRHNLNSLNDLAKIGLKQLGIQFISKLLTRQSIHDSSYDYEKSVFCEYVLSKI